VPFGLGGVELVEELLDHRPDPVGNYLERPLNCSVRCNTPSNKNKGAELIICALIRLHVLALDTGAKT
jgi:hypothetical protein